jgi:hypothetical protein
MTHSAKTKRYTLTLLESTLDEVDGIAADEGVTTVNILRRFVRLGLLVTKAQRTSGASLIIREDGQDKHILIV